MLGPLLALLPSILGPSVLPAETGDEDLPPDIAARGPGVEVRFEALDALLLARHGMSEDGRGVFELLFKRELLEDLAAEAGLEVSDQDVSRRYAELDRAARAAGRTDGIAPDIRRQGLSLEEFREYLRLALVQERLARRALGLGPGVEVGGEQQEIWLQQEVAQRGLERPSPPWPEGIVARCGSVTVTTAQFGAFLRDRLPAEDVREAAAHLLLLAAIEKRLPELTPEERTGAIELEVERRRAVHRASVPGMTFEQRLGASGRTIEQLREDPAVAVAALSRLWVDRHHGEEGLRRTYDEERTHFEGLHGHAVRAHLLFLVAGRFKNDLVKRTFEEAESELAKLAGRCGDLEDFKALARSFSEDPSTRESSGELGWITRERDSVARPLRQAIFRWLDEGGTVPAGGCTIAPVRLDSGAALLWLAEERPSPGWDGMREYVHQELRRRFVERVLPGDAVVFWK